MGYRWEDLFILAQDMLDRKRRLCNKYAEERGLGELGLDVMGLLVVMMHDLGQKHAKADLTHGPSADTIIRDSFGLPYVPFTGHPLCIALCKKHDHGIAMISGLVKYPGQDGFDPVLDFDRSLCTLAFESAFTNNICRNYHVRELEEIRTRASLVPLEHALWNVASSGGVHVWGFEGKGPLATRPIRVRDQPKLFNIEPWTKPERYGTRVGLGHATWEWRMRSGEVLKGPYFDYTVPYSQDDFEFARSYWENLPWGQQHRRGIELNELNELHQCPECGARHNSQQTLELHLNAFHGGPPPFPCNQENCNKGFSSGLALHIHTQRDHLRQGGDYKCDRCNKNFFLAVNLRLHIYTTHQDLYQCNHEGCSSAFGTQRRLAQHIQGVHGAKVHLCNHEGCSSAFSTQGQLAQHIRGVHGAKVYLCDHEGCSSAFCTERQLAQHIQGVHGAKVHLCNHEGCSSAFSTQGQLAQHIRGVHGAKVHLCNHEGCSSAFCTERQLAQHIQEVH
ncbi:hypothetical protein EV127DRAFT_392124, partial [Xylaria flabelliformis]